jgi:hypothetical protein
MFKGLTARRLYKSFGDKGLSLPFLKSLKISAVCAHYQQNIKMGMNIENAVS